MIEPAGTLAATNLRFWVRVGARALEEKQVPQVFYRSDVGSFWSKRSDLSDLDGVYLDAAIEYLRAKGVTPPIPALLRLTAQRRDQAAGDASG